MALCPSLLSRLADKELLRPAGLIGGQWLDRAPDGRTFEVRDPATGKSIATLPDMGAAETARAIDAAYRARPAWAERTGKERAAVLRRWYELVVEAADDLAVILTTEMGKPLAEARGEIRYGASFIEWFAEEAKRVYGDTIPGHERDKRILVLRQPIGVVGAVTPWNFPNAMVTRKVAPALAAGCAVVAKPSEQTPLSAIALAVLAARAGVPDGIFNVILASQGAVVGQELCRNEKVRKISFTGSTNTGRILMRQCADHIQKMSLELGGNAPFIVFDDADLDAAVEGAMLSKYRNAGQTCVCANRFYVQAGIYDAFAAKLAEKVRGLEVGPGFAPNSRIGPLIDGRALDKVQAHIKDAVAKGAKVLTGGAVHPAGPLFFEPTVLAGMDAAMTAAREETFGPVAALFPFEDEADAISQANDTEYGLAAYLYTQRLDRVWRVSEALEYGMVGINTGLISTEVAPFGGVKASGLGREGSKYGIEDYLEMKYLCVGL
jgi:succinate-semialdehyde dehydrogenase / glutarate-semialdehyde dehydrogenase